MAIEKEMERKFRMDDYCFEASNHAAHYFKLSYLCASVHLNLTMYDAEPIRALLNILKL